MNFVGIIPARGNSKSIPFKNIVNLCSKPLLNYTIEAAKESKIDDFFVSTESNKISKIAKEAGSKVILRPPELSYDDTPTLPVIEHALEQINDKYDFVVILQPTSPLRNSKHINEALDIFRNSGADSLVSVVEVPHNFEPHSVMKLNRRGFLDNFMTQDKPVYRRQNKKKYYGRNGAAIYISKIKNLNKGILSGNILPYFMNSKVSIDIDDKEDLEMAEILIKNNYL